MTDSRILPGARARLVTPDGLATREFYDFFRRLQSAASLQADLSAIATALGSPDGSIANIPPESYLPAGTEIVAGPGISVTGALSEGSAIVGLQVLTDDETGALLAITRDSYGRVQGTRPVEPEDVPSEFLTYLVDENGDYLRDEDGNLLTDGASYTLDGSFTATSFRVGSNQVVGARQTGWAAQTGTAARTAYATYAAPTITNPPTQAEVQAIANALQSADQRLKALTDDLITHGLIGP